MENTPAKVPPRIRFGAEPNAGAQVPVKLGVQTSLFSGTGLRRLGHDGWTDTMALGGPWRGPWGQLRSRPAEALRGTSTPTESDNTSLWFLPAPFSVGRMLLSGQFCLLKAAPRGPPPLRR